jgi:hypothetical protein
MGGRLRPLITGGHVPGIGEDFFKIAGQLRRIRFIFPDAPLVVDPPRDGSDKVVAGLHVVSLDPTDDTGRDAASCESFSASFPQSRANVIAIVEVAEELL